MLREAVEANPYHPGHVHGGLWLDALRRKDYAIARREAMATTSSSNFWGPLMRCVALAHLGRVDEAVRFRDELLHMRPRFAERSDWLIRRFVKDDALVARTKEGLALAGLIVD